MYSLPITTYSDYWRRTKQWSSYIGGLAVFAASTRYSMLEGPIVPHAMPLHSLQTSQSLGSEQLNTEDLANQRPLSESMVSEGVNHKGQTNQEVASQEEGQKLSNPSSSNQAMSNERAEDTTTVSVQVIEKKTPFETQYIESDKQNSKPVPKKKVIVQTSKPSANAEKEPVNLSDLNISKTLNVEATAYTYTGNNTATGVKPREGLIAVDPKVIAMGSQVYVEGYGYAIAADTGGSILGNRIDVFFGTLRQCIDWGRKPVRIHVLNPT